MNRLCDDDVRVIRRAIGEGWGYRTIARELGFARGTVRRYARMFGARPDPLGAMRKVSLPGLTNREKHLLAIRRQQMHSSIEPVIRGGTR